MNEKNIISFNYFGYDFFKKNIAHVHGIIMYSDNKDEADTLLKNNQKNIEESLTIEGKYSSKSDTLVLNTESANKLIKQKALNYVTKTGDKFTFKKVKNIPATPVLWTSKSDKSLIDDNGQTVEFKNKEYVVLGEYSATSKIIILDDKAYQQFTAQTKLVSVIKEKRDADKVLKSYIMKDSTPSQIFSYD